MGAAWHRAEESASRRQSATPRVWGSIVSAEIFAEAQLAHYTTTKRDVCTDMLQGVHAG
jgi:hypothetical protein